MSIEQAIDAIRKAGSDGIHEEDLRRYHFNSQLSFGSFCRQLQRKKGVRKISRRQPYYYMSMRG